MPAPREASGSERRRRSDTLVVDRTALFQCYRANSEGREGVGAALTFEWVRADGTSREATHAEDAPQCVATVHPDDRGAALRRRGTGTGRVRGPDRRAVTARGARRAPTTARERS